MRLAVSLAVVVSLIGCAEREETPATTSAPPSEPAPKAQSPAKIDPASLHMLKLAPGVKAMKVGAQGGASASASASTAPSASAAPPTSSAPAAGSSSGKK